MGQPGIPTQPEATAYGNVSEAESASQRKATSNRPRLRAQSEPPPNDRTKAYQGEELDALLRSKSRLAISEPPPGDCTQAYHGDELNALLRSNALPRRPEPPSSGHMRVHDRRQLGLLPPTGVPETGPEGVSVPGSSGAPLDDDEDATLAYVRANTEADASRDQQIRPAAGITIRHIVMDQDDATAQAIPNRLVFEGRSPLTTAPELLAATPLAGAPSAESVATLVPPPYAYGQPRSGTGLPWLWLAASVAAAALATLAVLGLRTSTPTTPQLSSELSASPTVNRLAPTTAVAALPLAHLEVDVPAPNAQLSLDGRPVSNPLRLSLPRDTAEHELRASAPGYVEKSHKFRMDRDVVVLLGLDRAQRTGR